MDDVISTGAERRSNEGGELVLGRPKEKGEPMSLCGWADIGAGALNVVEE